MNNRRGSLLATTSMIIEPIDIDNYLTIVALEDGLTASLSDNDIEYCIDGNGNLATLTVSSISPVINTGQTLSFRGNLATTLLYDSVGRFTISKSCNLTGNCNSLLFGDDAADNLDLTGMDNAFYELFMDCSTIKNVSSNFLPAATLADGCYNNMFQGCSKLNYIKAMFTTTPSPSYTSGWVYGVASSGTFVKNKNAAWNVTGVNGIPSGWTVQTA